MITPRLWSDVIEPYRSCFILAEPAHEPWQLRGYFALRHAVFVREQGMFQDHDRDAEDAHALPLVAMDTSFGMIDQVVGVVRIYPGAEGTWYGGRLAVLSEYRRSREVGAALIRAAVGAARGLCAERFLATVQEENVRYFERHHFHALSPVDVCGRAHRWMEADLSAFDVPGWVARYARSAA